MRTETDEINKRRRRRLSAVNAEHVGFMFQTNIAHSLLGLSALTPPTLEPQLAVLTRLHCLKSSLSVLTVSLILTNCTVVIAVHA